MKKLIIPVCLLLMCGIYWGSHLNLNKVYGQTIQLLDNFIIAHQNQEWQFFKPHFENFYLESLREEKERIILKQGLREFVVEKKSQGINDIDIIDEIYVGFKDFYLQVSNEIEQTFKECEIIFNPNTTDMWKFNEERKGIKIDTNDLLLNICCFNPRIELKIIEQEATYKKEELQKHLSLRSKEFTSFVGSESGRRYNIIKALDCFNGLVVHPNEEISFQNILDKNDNGLPYKEATVILNGEFVKGVGGGVCQASTTIYNAALMAGLEILEVHNHTLPVGYVERGFDAMVNDSGLDLRFRNNTNFPIYFKTYSKNSHAYAEVYGTAMEYKLKKVSEQIEKINPPEPKVIPDEKGEYINHIKYKGEYYTKRYAQFGYKVNAYLEVYENNILKEKILIRKETYAPTQSIIYEGVQDKNAVEVEQNTINEE